MKDRMTSPEFAIAAISNSTQICMRSEHLQKIAGLDIYPLSRGVGLIPRATVVANYQLADDSFETLTGTIGLPKTEGRVGTTPVFPFTGSAWCLPVRNSFISHFYNESFERTVSLNGTWAIVADGTQTADEVTLFSVYGSSFSRDSSGDRQSVIFPGNISLRISSLECSISTPTEINFGTVDYNSGVNNELAAQTNPLSVTCSQESDNANGRINANINLQFSPISRLYEGNGHRLSLDQGGDLLRVKLIMPSRGVGAVT